MLLFWLLAYNQLWAYGANVVLDDYTNPNPERRKLIWNPFPDSCGHNATSVRCGGVCHETCTYKSISQFCVYACGVPCICNPGYIFSEQDLRCILRSDCPPGVQQLVDWHRVFH
ncbi:GH23083 [Drosophila grimshawi]|uniref:GH23083 n=2 Tax=Drosophila grimshawi TaxID=7222 RepID=B4JWP1_DROGR|nr:GH23083 [Drosophila grimshawi]